MRVEGRGTAEAFRSPDAWHSPATYWFWHHLPDDGQIRTQVREMHTAGFRSFQIQARLSYPLGEYLDARYLRACRIAVEEAARLDMIVGIYDDYNWQTGHAAGRAVAGHDALRERQLFWTRIDVKERTGEGEISSIRSATESLGPAAMTWHYEGGVPTWADWHVEQAIVGSGETAADATGTVTITGSENGCRIAVDLGADAPATSVLVLVSARCATSRLVNPLDRAAVERFVEAGYEPFQEAVGDYFGTTVRYVFFDQPHAVYYDWAERSGNPRSSIPVHDTLISAVRENFGADVPAVISAVIEETTDAAALQRRAQFWALFSELAIEVFLGTLSQWSHSHGLLQSGHEVLSHVGSWSPGAAFDNWDLRANFGLDHFAIDRYRDLTAVDAQDAVSQLSPRLGDSIARASGRSGTIVEQYFVTPPEGGTPWSGHWGLTLDELRSTAITHHFAGMRQMVFHGFYQTHGHGEDHESLRNPRFDFPPGVNFEPWFNEHHATYAAEVARLSEFLDGVDDEPEVLLLWPLRTIWTHGQLGQHVEHLGAWAQALSEAGIAFRVVDERDLAGFAGGNLPDARVLVMPSIRTLESERSTQALRGLAAIGIRIIASGDVLSVFQNGNADATEAWAQVPSEVLSEVPTFARIRDTLRLRARQERTLFAIKSDDGDVSASTAGVIVRAGAARDGRVHLALFHDGEHPVRGVLCGYGITEWVASDGSNVVVDDPWIVLEPGELRLFVVEEPAAPKASASEAPAPGPHRLRSLSQGWTLTLPGTVETSPIDVAGGWQIEHPTYSGIGIYRTEFEATAITDMLLRLPSVAGSVIASVNGRSLGARGWSPYKFTVPRSFLSSGRNTLELTVSGSVANRYYASTGLREAPEPNGILAAPTLEELR